MQLELYGTGILLFARPGVSLAICDGQPAALTMYNRHGTAQYLRQLSANDRLLAEHGLAVHLVMFASHPWPHV